MPLSLFEQISYYSLKCFCILLSWVPRPLLGGIRACLFQISRPFIKTERRNLGINIEKIWGLPRGTHFAQMFETQVLLHQLAAMSESIRIIRNPGEAKVTGIEAIEKLIHSAELAGKGHLIVTAHLGSWELVAYHGAKAASKPFHVLAKPPKNRGTRKLLEELREQMGVRVLWTDRKTLLRDMLQNVRSGGSIGFVMDQKPEGRKGPLVNFFGHSTEFVSGPAAIASKTGCAVISLFCLRVAPFHYHLISRELLPPGTASSDTDSLTQAMAAEIERVIRLYPEQWCWNYKRWRFSSSMEV